MPGQKRQGGASVSFYSFYYFILSHDAGEFLCKASENSSYGIIRINHKTLRETNSEASLKISREILNLIQVYGRVQDVSGHRARTK